MAEKLGPQVIDYGLPSLDHDIYTDIRNRPGDRGCQQVQHSCLTERGKGFFANPGVQGVPDNVWAGHGCQRADDHQDQGHSKFPLIWANIPRQPLNNPRVVSLVQRIFNFKMFWRIDYSHLCLYPRRFQGAGAAQNASTRIRVLLTKKVTLKSLPNV